MSPCGHEWRYSCQVVEADPWRRGRRCARCGEWQHVRVYGLDEPFASDEDWNNLLILENRRKMSVRYAPRVEKNIKVREG